VQGVWFRAAARERATELGVAGFARNLPDGRVELEAEGPPARIEAFLAWCGEGPPGARVESVEVQDRDPVAGPPGFRIARDA
ncbi:MAG TPA: acylphosphatase, partial [Thermoanaerobaculia bacterium]|nr:acylphosphatase [Thermoanaerobaculia bacterium]